MEDVAEGKDYSFPMEEEKVLELWDRLDAFKEQLRRTEGQAEYIFYDGPPFATGLPHYGHILAGTLKASTHPHCWQSLRRGAAWRGAWSALPAALPMGHVHMHACGEERSQQAHATHTSARTPAPAHSPLQNGLCGAGPAPPPPPTPRVSPAPAAQPTLLPACPHCPHCPHCPLARPRVLRVVRALRWGAGHCDALRLQHGPSRHPPLWLGLPRPTGRVRNRQEAQLGAPG
jgi:hypothetical protein